LLSPVASAPTAAVPGAAVAGGEPTLDLAVYLYALEENLPWLRLASGSPG